LEIGDEWLLDDILENSDGFTQSSPSSGHGHSEDDDMKQSRKRARTQRTSNPSATVIKQAMEEGLQALNLDPNSAEGKLKKKQIRNRMSAQMHRDNKKMYINNLEAKSKEYEQQITDLRAQVMEYATENNRLRQLLGLPSQALPFDGKVEQAAALPTAAAEKSAKTTAEQAVGSGATKAGALPSLLSLANNIASRAWQPPALQLSLNAIDALSDSEHSTTSGHTTHPSSTCSGSESDNDTASICSSDNNNNTHLAKIVGGGALGRTSSYRQNSFALFSIMLLFSFSFWTSPFLPWQRHAEQATEILMTSIAKQQQNSNVERGVNTNQGFYENMNNNNNNYSEPNDKELSEDLIMLLDELSNNSNEESNPAQQAAVPVVTDNSDVGKREEVPSTSSPSSHANSRIIVSRPIVSAVSPSTAVGAGSTDNNNRNGVESTEEDNNMFALTAYQHNMGDTHRQEKQQLQQRLLLQNQLQSAFLQFYDTYEATLKYVEGKQSLIGAMDTTTRQIASLHPVSFLFSSMLNDLGLQLETSNTATGSGTANEKSIVPVGNWRKPFEHVLELYKTLQHRQTVSSIPTSTVKTNNNHVSTASLISAGVKQNISNNSTEHHPTNGTGLVRYLRGKNTEEQLRGRSMRNNDSHPNNATSSTLSNTEPSDSLPHAPAYDKIDFPMPAEVYELVVLNDMMQLLQQYVELHHHSGNIADSLLHHPDISTNTATSGGSAGSSAGMSKLVFAPSSTY